MRPSSSAALACLLLILGSSLSHAETDLRIDCSKPAGVIRPLHGSNCGPIQCGELLDLSAYHRELAIPFTRLHDCHWPNPDVVDIHAIFPSFTADPSLPASYDFRRTDDYIQAIVNVGSAIVYRLGESIEHTKKKYYVHPPADPDHWAAICLGIIRHYNDGWANGFRHNIRYWEIWNEPENRPSMWTGNDEDYFRLYETAAKAIKAKYPALKVGGPSLGYTGRIVAGRFEPGEFLIKFLDRCKDRSIPLDFLSWHLYTNDPSECLIRARGIRAALDQRGFKSTELHFNEWNYLPDNDWKPMGREGQGLPREKFYQRMGGPEGAAFSACVLLNLQDSPVDVSNYYMADNQGFGLFSTDGVPKKSFYALKAFRLLLDTPLRVKTEGGDPKRLALCAGLNADKSELRILISNFASSDGRVRLKIDGLPWQGPSRGEVLMVDSTHDLSSVKKARFEGAEIRIDLNAPAVCLIRMSRG